MSQWYRLYTEAIRDKKLRTLPVSQRWLWVTILALAKESEEPGKLLKFGDIPLTVQDLADAAAISVGEVESGLRAFMSPGRGMMHRDGGVLVVTNWNARQFKSDNVTERVNKFRRGNVSGNVSQRNGPEQSIAESETETEAAAREKSQNGEAAAAPALNASRKTAADVPTVSSPPAAADFTAVLLAKGFTIDEITQAKARVDGRPNPPQGVTNWASYLQPVIKGIRNESPPEPPVRYINPPKAKPL